MAFKNSIELYSSLILPRLAEGPKTREQLGVPQYAVERLRDEGLVKPRMFELAPSVAVQVWFLPEDLKALDEVPPAPRLKHCWELTDEDWPQENDLNRTYISLFRM